MSPEPSRSLHSIAASACGWRKLTMVLITGFFAGWTAEPGWAYRLPEAPPKQPSGELQALETLSRGVATIADQASRAVVFVSVAKEAPDMPMGHIDPFEFFWGIPDRQRRGRGGRRREAPKQRGVGSGFFVDLDKGYVVTNNHVVEGADEISLKVANGDRYSGKVVGRDSNTDIAVVQVTESFNKEGLAALPLGDSKRLRVGEIVVALGAPFELESSLSFGVVSAVGRGTLGITKMGDFIQTDAAINPGNSGGPLLNTAGQVVGVNTAIYSRSGAYNGIGFAVPSNLARVVADRLINDGKVSRGFLGVGLRELDREQAKDFGLPEGTVGALISEVQTGGPADDAGLEVGDIVVEVSYDDGGERETKRVDSNSDLVNVIGLRPPGSTVTITYYRDGDRQQRNVTLGTWPGDDGSGPGLPRGNTTFGMRLAAVNDSTQRRFGFSSDHGAVVTGITEGTAAYRAGIEVGDVLLKVNGRRVKGPRHFAKLTKDRQRMLIRLERDGQYLIVSLTR